MQDWREFLKPHETELLQVAEYNLECAKETASTLRETMRERAKKRRAKIKEFAS